MEVAPKKNDAQLGPYPRQQHLIIVGRFVCSGHWQPGLATLLGVPRQTVENWASGAELMPAEAVEALNKVARRHTRLLNAQCDFIERIERD